MPSENPQQPIVALITKWDDEQSKLLQWPLHADSEIAIGRERDNTISFPADNRISRHHCRVQAEGKQLWINDLGSRNGTYLNGQRIHEKSPVTLPAWIAAGGTRLSLVHPDLKSEQSTELHESVYSTKGSIIVPSSEAFEEFTQAMLVVDLEQSSQMIREMETQFVKTIVVIGEILERGMLGQSHIYLQNTGDGFLACFADPAQALATVTSIMPAIRKINKTNVRVSAGMHWGSSIKTVSGELLGKDVHATFSVENVRRGNPHIDQLLASNPDATIVLMTNNFLERLPPPLQTQAVSIGHYPLKGLENEHEIFLWHSGNC